MKPLALLLTAVVAVTPLTANLLLERTISLPSIKGRIDHFSLDATRHRLFIAALGNNTVEVVGLAEGHVVHSIPGLAEPQGINYVASVNRLFIATGADGDVRVFDGTTFAAIADVKLGDDADNLRYDPGSNKMYVGFGSGALAAIDVGSNAITANVTLKGHPESFQMEMHGPRIFVNVPGAHEIAVIDREKNVVTSTWTLESASANFPMVLDEANRRLIVGCRAPPRLIVFDIESGKEVAQLGLHGDCDDLFLDSARRHLYASCGEGFIDVFTQADADHYALTEMIKTESKARTCFFDDERLYLAVPKRGDRSAEVRCYRVRE